MCVYMYLFSNMVMKHGGVALGAGERRGVMAAAIATLAALAAARRNTLSLAARWRRNGICRQHQRAGAGRDAASNADKRRQYGVKENMREAAYRHGVARRGGVARRVLAAK